MRKHKTELCLLTLTYRRCKTVRLYNWHYDVSLLIVLDQFLSKDDSPYRKAPSHFRAWNLIGKDLQLPFLPNSSIALKAERWHPWTFVTHFLLSFTLPGGFHYIQTKVIFRFKVYFLKSCQLTAHSASSKKYFTWCRSIALITGSFMWIQRDGLCGKLLPPPKFQGIAHIRKLLYFLVLYGALQLAR